MFSLDNKNVKERVQELRKNHKLTQQEMGISLDITRKSYGGKEASGNFNWEEILMLSDLFNISPYFLKYGAEYEDLLVVSKIIKQQGGLRQANVMVGDDTQIYTSFLNLPKVDQTRILKHIEENFS